MKERLARTSRSVFRRRTCPNAWRIAIFVPCALLLSACAPLAAVLNFGPPAVQVAAQADQVKFAADGVALVGSGKTVTDHAISIAMGRDCQLTNPLAGNPVCANACQ